MKENQGDGAPKMRQSRTMCRNGVAFKECESSNSDDEEYNLVMNLNECQSCGYMVKRGHNSANCTCVGRVTEAEQDETNVELDQTTDSD